MAANSFLFLFIAVLLFSNFSQIASSGIVYSHSDIKSEIRGKNNHVTSPDLTLDHVASEKMLRSLLSKVAGKEVIISAKLKSADVRGNTKRAQMPISVKVKSSNFDNDAERAQIPISAKEKTRNLNRNTKKAQIPVAAKFNIKNSKGSANIKKKNLSVLTKFKTKDVILNAHQGKAQIYSSAKAVQKVKVDRKLDDMNHASSAVRVSKRTPSNLTKKTIRTERENAKKDLHTSSRFQNTNKAEKKARESSRSFPFRAASTKFLKRFQLNGHHTHKVANRKSETIFKHSRIFSKKTELAKGKYNFENKKTLAASVKAADIEMNTAKVSIRQATEISVSPVPTHSFVDLEHQKKHYEYTTKYPESCSCAIAEGMHTGDCWHFLDSSKTSCEKRTCAKSYVCVIGDTTDLTCLRRENTKRIVSNGDGSCRTEEFKSFQYILYSS